MTSRSEETFIKLLHLRGIGYKFLKGFYERFGTFGENFEENLREFLKEKYPKRDPDEVLSTLRSKERWKELFGFLEKFRVGVIPFFDKRFPRELYLLGLSVPALFLIGELPTDGFAIVGTRRASAEGKRMTERFAAYLAEKGIPVISGGAAGIDRAAHGGALSVGGITGVIAGEGLMPFISKNGAFVRRILDNGGFILSQFPLTTTGAKWTFPQRNALIAYFGFRGTLIVEAPKRSGALITADYAERLKRPLFAYLNCTHNPAYGGNVELIKGGRARLITEPQELLDSVENIHKGNSSGELPPAGGSKENSPERFLKEKPRTFEELLILTSLPEEELLEKLTLLELEGKVIQEGGYYIYSG